MKNKDIETKIISRISYMLHDLTKKDISGAKFWAEQIIEIVIKADEESKNEHV